MPRYGGRSKAFYRTPPYRTGKTKAKISRKCTFDILADRDHDKIQSERHDMFKFVLVETLLNIAELGANINYYVTFFIIIS